MIYELRTYTLHPGKVPAYLDLAATVGRPVRGNDYGTNHGYWASEFGTLNQVWHLWSYASLDERERLRGELSRNERWRTEYVPNVRPLMVRQDIRFLNPAIAIKPPDGAGHLYELRISRTQPGAAGAYAELLASYLPVRERYSPIVGLWTGEAPQPNEVAHLWAYPDLNIRMKARAEAAADPRWREFLAKGGPMLAEMQNTLLLPAAFSPMR
jgi:hypothetical protein